MSGVHINDHGAMALGLLLQDEEGDDVDMITRREREGGE
jgi:hypothetical protein